MESALHYLTIALGISIVVNLILKRLGISQIIGYILTGMMVAYGFDLRHLEDTHTLETIAEFGVVFLMFTIGLEVSLRRLASMKIEVFLNGFLQTNVTALVIFSVCYWVFKLNFSTSLIVAMSLSLSSTAVVLSYLKSTKEIARPYGQRAMGILIYQDLAVIPILLLIGFMGAKNDNIIQVLLQTTVSAAIIAGLLFVVGKKVMTWLLYFSSSSNVDELFMGSVLLIVVGASLIVHAFGFTYSLGAFIAGMIIAETHYHHKVEADIAPFKDLLLGTFFVTVGMKIDIQFFGEHILQVLGILFLLLLLKAVIIFGVVNIYSKSKVAFKTAMALSQVGEFSFAIFALSGNENIIDEDTVKLLVLVTVLSLLLTPFILSKISIIAGLIFKEKSTTEDFDVLQTCTDHVIVCGYGFVGKIVTKSLREEHIQTIVVDNNYKNVQQAIADGEKAFYGDMSKTSILGKIHLQDAASVIVTLDNSAKKRLICESILTFAPNMKIVAKVTGLEEKRELRGVNVSITVDSKKVVAEKLVYEALSGELPH